ncbi:MAG: hypothetical protein ACLFR2_09030 [Candidatus Kapaibacterium sp.]
MNIENTAGNQAQQRQNQPVESKAPVSVQMEIQKDILKQATTQTGSTNIQNQMLQLLASAQPLFQIQQTAQNQISKGYLDIKI